MVISPLDLVAGVAGMLWYEYTPCCKLLLSTEVLLQNKQPKPALNWIQVWFRFGLEIIVIISKKKKKLPLNDFKFDSDKIPDFENIPLGNLH